MAGSDLLLVLEMPREAGTWPGPVRRLIMHYSSVEPGPIIELRRDDEPVTRRQLWTLRGWDGAWPADSTEPRAKRQ